MEVKKNNGVQVNFSWNEVLKWVVAVGTALGFLATGKSVTSDMINQLNNIVNKVEVIQSKVSDIQDKNRSQDEQIDRIGEKLYNQKK